MPIKHAMATNFGLQTTQYLNFRMTPNVDHTFGFRLKDDFIMIEGSPVTFVDKFCY